MSPTAYDLDEAVFETAAAYLDAHPLVLMHERVVKMVTDEVVWDVYAYALSLGISGAMLKDEDEDDDDEDETFYTFVHDRVDVYVTTIACRALPAPDPSPASDPDRRLEAHLADLRSRPQPEQRTPAWYEFRRHLLTASEIAKLLTSEASVTGSFSRNALPRNPRRTT